MRHKAKSVLVFGGTRYFGKHLVEELIAQGHVVTIATRGKVTDSFGALVERSVKELDGFNEASSNI